MDCDVRYAPNPATVYRRLFDALRRGSDRSDVKGAGRTKRATVERAESSPSPTGQVSPGRFRGNAFAIVLDKTQYCGHDSLIYQMNFRRCVRA